MEPIQWPQILEVQGQPVNEQVIEHQYRALAKKRHPDAGGSNEAMTALNLAKESALKWVADQQQRRAQAEAAKIAAAQAETVFRNVFNQQMAQAQYNAGQWANAMHGLGGIGGGAANAAVNQHVNTIEEKEEKRRTKWERVRDILRGKQ